MSRPVSVASRLSLRRASFRPISLRPVVSLTSRPLSSAIRLSSTLPTLHRTTLPSTTTPRTYSTMSDHGNVITINSDAEFKEKVTESQDTIILDCFATWCGPCKAIAPKVAELSNAYPQAKFYQIDIDQLSSTAAELGVRAMPTFMLFKGGQKVSEVVGADPNKLKAGIESLVA